MISFKKRPASRLLLAHAKSAVRSYNGSEDSADRLITALAAFERLVQQTQPKLPRDDAEKRIARRLGSSRPASVGDLLDVAAQQYELRFSANQIKVKIAQSSFVFVPTDGQGPMPPGPVPQHKFEKPKLSPRTAKFLAALTRPGSGVFLDDLRIVRGQVKPGAMRTEPYTLIQLPRHDHEVLICDEVGNVSFVGTGLRGEIFWATYQKKQLKQFADITPVINTAHSDERLIDLILHDNQAKPKAVVGTYIKLPLTEDIILIHALRYAEKHEGKLPAAHTIDDIEGLPGEKWSNWDTLLRLRLRGLDRACVKGLSHLFNLYNLKQERNVNPEALIKAIETLEATGTHGLVIDNALTHQLTEDMILIAALRYAKANNYHLPPQDKTEIEGYPGQTWNMWGVSLRERTRGLEREDLKGLNDLFKIYSLQLGRKENTTAIKQAVELLEKTGNHGLMAVRPKEEKLNEDMVLTLALSYAKANKGKLPTLSSGEVDGLLGKTWRDLNNALHNHSFGLEREGVDGLSHFFNLYRLKTGYKENQDVVAGAIKQMDETNHHGLNLIVDRPLSELVSRRPRKFAQLETP